MLFFFFFFLVFLCWSGLRFPLNKTSSTKIYLTIHNIFGRWIGITQIIETKVGNEDWSRNLEDNDKISKGKKIAEKGIDMDYDC